MQRVVISDASPLHYLILIGHAEVLPSLYTEVLIPEAVAKELQQPATPESVRDWIVHSLTFMASCCLCHRISQPCRSCRFRSGRTRCHSFSTKREGRSGNYG